MAKRQDRHEMGPGGHCVCPRCGGRLPHRRGTHCQDERCPSCGSKMLREGSQHHELWRAKHEREASDGSTRPGDDEGQAP
jgi:predicted amidophosphoribosyltransferase